MDMDWSVLSIKDMLGFHMSSGEENPNTVWAEYCDWGHAIQFFSGNPVETKSPDLEKFKTLWEDSLWIPVLHGPYWTNLTDYLHWSYMKTLGFIEHHCKVFQTFAPSTLNGKPKQLKLVLHPGLNEDPVGWALSMGEFKLFMKEMQDNYGDRVVVCLENSPSSKSKNNSLFSLLEWFKHHPDMPDNIRFCHDTCHSFVSGDWPDPWPNGFPEGLLKVYEDMLGVVHLNSSSANAHLGSGLDRHSYNSLLSGHPEIFRNFSKHIPTHVPVILERRCSKIIKEDLKTVRDLSQFKQLLLEAWQEDR